MKRTINGIASIIAENSILAHHKSSTWCLSQGLLKGCLPVIQVFRCLSLKISKQKQRGENDLKNRDWNGKKQHLDVSNKQTSLSLRVKARRPFKPLRTFKVNALPSRPSGNSTVNNFLSSLTTTLHRK